MIFLEIVEIARIDKLKIAKQGYDVHYREKIPLYKEHAVKSSNMTVISMTQLLKLILDKFGEDSKEWLIINLYASIGARDNLYLHIIEKFTYLEKKIRII